MLIHACAHTHYFANIGSTTGTSNVGCHFGMRYGKDYPFARKEVFCTYTVFSTRAYVMELPIWTHVNRLKVTQPPLFMILDPV
jgi:hypothetical protein